MNEIDLPPEHPTFALSRVRIRKDDHPAFAEMVKLAKALPMRSFVKDLTFHDRNALRNAPRERGFAWMLRPSGATLFWQGARVDVDTIASASDEGAVYWWDGVSLVQRTPEQAKERLDAPSYDKAVEILAKHGLTLHAESINQFSSRWITSTEWGSRAYRTADDLRGAGFGAELEKTDTKDIYRIVVVIP